MGAVANSNDAMRDTGPLVAYLDARDPAHGAECWDGFTGRLATTGAVIAESMHFVTRVPEGPRHLAALVSDSGMDIYDLTQPPELLEAARLMEQYADPPMGFADATLVLLAGALRIDDVLSLDYRGFSTYRTRRGRPLTLVLEPTR